MFPQVDSYLIIFTFTAASVEFEEPSKVPVAAGVGVQTLSFNTASFNHCAAGNYSISPNWSKKLIDNCLQIICHC